jgi:hypothetical protein
MSPHHRDHCTHTDYLLGSYCTLTYIVSAGHDKHPDDLLVAVDDKITTHFLQMVNK